MPANCVTRDQKHARRPSIPYGRQWVDEDDIAAVVEVLRSDWLTTGPKVDEFEWAFAEFAGVREAVALSSGTAALHAAMFALGIGPGDDVIVPPMTFAATADAVVYQGGRPVFADVDPQTLLLDPQAVEACITSRTKAVVAVDYAGHPCDYDALREITDLYGLALVADACHALGGRYKGRAVGSLADLNTFSFHPVKQITTAEGGMVTTNDVQLAGRMRMFRNHGIDVDHRERARRGAWFYGIAELGFNYRLSDVQCALGLSQLHKLERWVARRQAIAARYDAALADVPGVSPLLVRPEVSHAYHLYVVRLAPGCLGRTRDEVLETLHRAGIGVNVHYIPVHLHPLYRRRLGTRPGMCPHAERASDEILSLPIFPKMSEADVVNVIDALRCAAEGR